ncbi:hypothetical protein K491DRAFT_686240 [Lophiostoma macrostomum CBS 122681]|uniref:DUF1772-domain-containing protein n=1 Tax=Lophiostoma macrostomum CBS 122681 TaxID=1314788 RepID=A0A6A6TTR8_9PLEO|nr:hypothetical protein K491DRAFT_686240 [Lophiostoma macrostomum CBS 122681]
MSTKALQVISISSALIGSGGIATLSLFDIPELQSQPASRSLPMIRWLFSRGSHTFPTIAIISSSSFVSLAYKALPAGDRTLSGALKHVGSTGPAGLYLAAAVLAFSIAPFTAFAMIPTNFTLIRKNEELGGARSAESAKHGNVGERSAEESVDGKDDISQWRDVSVPQAKTEKDSSEREDREVKALLGKFGQLNSVRAILIGAGGIVGLLAALS